MANTFKITIATWRVSWFKTFQRLWTKKQSQTIKEYSLKFRTLIFPK